LARQRRLSKSCHLPFSYQEFISGIALKLFRQQRKHKYNKKMGKKYKKLLFHFKSFKCVAHAQRA